MNNKSFSLSDWIHKKKHMNSIKSKSIIIANQYDTETIQ